MLTENNFSSRTFVLVGSQAISTHVRSEDGLLRRLAYIELLIILKILHNIILRKYLVRGCLQSTNRSGEAVVTELYRAVFVDQNISWLDITVDNIRLMHVLQC